MTSTEGIAIELEPIELVEERRELMREAKHSLEEWERHRAPEVRQRLIDSLEGLARLVRGAAA